MDPKRFPGTSVSCCPCCPCCPSPGTNGITESQKRTLLLKMALIRLIYFLILFSMFRLLKLGNGGNHMWNFPGVHQCQRMVSISRANAGQVCLVSLKKIKTIPHHQPRVEKAVQMEATCELLTQEEKDGISWKSRKATLGSGMACATAWDCFCCCLCTLSCHSFR